MAELLEYKCPCCGGAIEFDSSLQKMKCPYCDTEFEVETLKELDTQNADSFEDDMRFDSGAEGEWTDGGEEGVRVYVCSSCGGEILADETTAATKCPYCDSPVVMKEQFAGMLKPDLIIPFKLDKTAAKEAFLSHLKGKKLLPKVFKDEAHVDEIKGVYVPFWLFDADARANIRYRATRVFSYRRGDYIITNTDHFAVLREGDLSFERIPVDGSSKMADDLMESLEPFYVKDAVDFQTAYLAGFLADRYDVDAEQSVARANERIKKSTEETFRRTVVGYATVVPEKTSVRLENGVARYALYPVWILNTSWKGEKYVFAMNGQTGKFVGDLPMDKGAFWKWFFGIFALAGAAAFGLLTLIALL
jgi:DNA-directed RNA polymerase subunit RPC12/RpoP